MSRATKKFHVVFNSEGGIIFRMVLPDRELRFHIIPNGLYHFDFADRENIVLLINTLLENREGFTQKEYEGDREARRAMHLLGFPSDQDFDNMVRSNMIVNCPITFADVKMLKLFFVLISPR